MSAPNEPKHIHRAYLTSLKEGVIELFRDWKAARTPPLSLEGKLQGYLSVFPLPASDYGLKSGYYVDEAGRVVFVFDPSRYGDVDYKVESIYVAGGFNGWQNAVGRAEWRLSPEKIGGRKVFAIRLSPEEFSCPNGACFKFVTGNHRWFPAAEGAPNLRYDGMGNVNYEYRDKQTGRHRLGFVFKNPIDLSDDNVVLYHTRKGVERASLVPGEFFFQLKTYKELGAIVGDDEVTFRLFAPRAKWVKLGYFENLDRPEDMKWILMKKDVDHVWEAKVSQNLTGWYYWYRLDGPENAYSLFDPTFKLLDPYALAAVTREGPAIVVDPQAYGCLPRFRANPQWQDLVILEGHVRDFVARVGGLDREEGAPHGFADLSAYARRDDFYPKRLGVNAIELQPVQENDSQSYGEYHWGYMTANYFAPASNYASDPEAGSQVAEFRELVSTLHDEGFSVILDVVYNHVGEPAHLMFIDKLYYFHGGVDGSLSNWSGCGNDLRTDAPMARRLVVDSLKHFVQFYGVDGFRFDLADLVGKPVLMEVERELKQVRPDIILIAEPWSFKGHIGRDLRDTGYASWNDGYREFIKKYVVGNGNLPGLRYFLTGSADHYASWPAQTVNYVESHDDRVWIDEITENGGNDGTRPTAHDVARTRLMAALLMMSIGMPMLHAGMDFLGTKNGVRNTYQDGARNALDYRRAHQYSACARYFADWVAWRSSQGGRLVRHFQRVSAEFFHFMEGPDGQGFACIYNANGEMGEGRLLFAVNPMLYEASIPLGDWAGLPWRQVADHERFLAPRDLPWANVPDGSVILPPLACGLWEL